MYSEVYIKIKNRDWSMLNYMKISECQINESVQYNIFQYKCTGLYYLYMFIYMCGVFL